MTEELSFEQKSTLWVGGISDQVDEEILYELFQNVRGKKHVVETCLLKRVLFLKRQKHVVFRNYTWLKI